MKAANGSKQIVVEPNVPPKPPFDFTSTTPNPHPSMMPAWPIVSLLRAKHKKTPTSMAGVFSFCGVQARRSLPSCHDKSSGGGRHRRASKRQEVDAGGEVADIELGAAREALGADDLACGGHNVKLHI